MGNVFLDASPTLQALVLAVLTAGALCLLIGQVFRYPLLLHIGLRSMLRRRSQTVIMIAGLALSSVFITATFGLSDSMSYSQELYRTLVSGSVDEAITGPLSQDQVAHTLAQLQHMPEVEHAAAAVVIPRSANINVSGLALTQVDVLAVGPDFDQVYGPIQTRSGQSFQFGAIALDEVIITPALAQRTAIREGDTVQIQLANQTVSRRARVVLAHDIVLTTGELQFNGSYPVLILSLAEVQQLYQQAHQSVPIANLICIKNTVPANAHSQTINTFLSQSLHAYVDPYGSIPTQYTDAIRLNPIKPDVVSTQGFFTPVAGKDEVAASPAARQFNYLLPIFTALLVGAGLLLLVLLVLLLATERRAELGMSRAVGMQRSHVIQALLIECTGYGMLASIPGILLGIGVLAVGLTILAHLPSLGLSNEISYHLWISWQSLLSVWCLGILTTMGAALLTATWVSRDTIVAAIRNLDSPAEQRTSFRQLIDALLFVPKDGTGQAIPETPACRSARRTRAGLGLLYELIVCGPIPVLLAGGVVLLQARSTMPVGDLDWRDALPLISGTLFIAGGALLLRWLLSTLKVPGTWAWRISLSLIGIGWLYYGLNTRTGFLFAFEPVWNRTPSLLSNILSMVIPLIGGVLLIVSNADLIAILVSKSIRNVRGWSPLSRIGLVYPLTFRFRTGVTVTLLGLVTFLVVLLVTNNASFLQQQQQTNGGFQMSVRVANSMNLKESLLNTPSTFKTDVSAVGRLRRTYFTRRIDGQRVPYPIRALLPGHPPAVIGYTGPEIVDDGFLTHVSLPLLAHAQGFSTDSQVWSAMRSHPEYTVLYYQNGIQGLQPQQNFTPFQIEAPDGDTTSAHYHRLTVIGLMPATSPWRSILISAQTARAFGWDFEGDMPWPWSDPIYYFKLQDSVHSTQAMQDVSRGLHLGELGVQVNALDQDDTTAYTTNLTTLLAGYMTLGLLFGTLSIGVITSRAVVERRQQIGMLRSLGFSPTLMLSAFLLESSFIITLGLLTGTALAAWVAYQVSRQGSQSFPVPVMLICLLLGSCYVIAGVFTILPARQAARLSPAEALRYE